MPDPKVLALDIETYGACVRNAKGRELPLQTVFHPQRSLHTDGVALEDLILTVAITLPKEDPRWPTSYRAEGTIVLPSQTAQPDSSTSTNSVTSPTSGPLSSIETTTEPTRTQGPEALPSSWNGSLLATLTPGETLVFRMDRRKERDLLRGYLAHADTLLLMNGQFDLLYLRCLNDFKFILDGSHFLIDASIVNYLENEVRPERSLKTMGPVLRTHVYDRTASERFHSPSDPKLHLYNAQDTHNTMLVISELAKRIRRRFVPSPTASLNQQWACHKLSEFCLRFYSDTLWSCIRMSEAGVPHNWKSLAELEATLLAQCEAAVTTAQTNFSLTLGGEGSHKSKAAFLDLVINTIDGVIPCEESSYSNSASDSEPESASPSAASSSTGLSKSVRNHPLLQLTDKTRQVSFNEENRKLLASLLPPDSPLLGALEAWGSHIFAQKLVSSYTFPLLRHRRNKPDKKDSVCIPITDSLRSYIASLGLNTTTPTAEGNTSDSKSPLIWETSTSGTASNGSANNLENVALTYPSWFVTPSPTKDSTGAEGGTLQGRITCKGGSHQTDPPLIKARRASRFGEAGCLGSLDLSQIELRVPALLSGDPTLLAAYVSGLDLHSDRATQVFGADIRSDPNFGGGDGKVDPRQWAKTFNFADLFLASAGRMQRTLLEQSGKLFPTSFFQNIELARPKARPGLFAWQWELAERAEKDGFLALPYTGQSRYFNGFAIDRLKWKRKGLLRGKGGETKDVISEVVNFPVQTTAGNTLLRLQAYMHKHLPALNHRKPPVFMYLNVYDALYFDCLLTFLDELKATLASGIEWLVTQDYWAWLQEMNNRTVPLSYGLAIYVPCPKCHLFTFDKDKKKCAQCGYKVK